MNLSLFMKILTDLAMVMGVAGMKGLVMDREMGMERERDMERVMEQEMEQAMKVQIFMMRMKNIQ